MRETGAEGPAPVSGRDASQEGLGGDHYLLTCAVAPVDRLLDGGESSFRGSLGPAVTAQVGEVTGAPLSTAQ